MSISLLEALANAGQEDLNEITAKIDTLTKELDSLKEAKRLLDRRINGKPAAKNGDMLELAEALLAKRGRATAKEIGAELGANTHSVGQRLAASPLFQKDGNVWSLVASRTSG